MKHSSLKESPHYIDACLSLIEKNFHYQSPFHYKEDFYPLMAKANHAHNHLLIDERNEKLVGHIGVSLRMWGEKKVALLGGIAIDENYQGQGLFKKLFLEVLSLYEKETKIFVLWSDLHTMYEKYGFSPLAGMIQTGKEDFKCPQGYEEKSFSSLTELEFQELGTLYEVMGQSYTTLKRSLEDWNLLREINSTKIYIAKENEHIVRYFCVGKGMDLNDIIHEVGFKNLQEKEKLYKDLRSFKLWLPFCEKTFFPDAQELILALVKGDLQATERLYISGLDSI